MLVTGVLKSAGAPLAKTKQLCIKKSTRGHPLRGTSIFQRQKQGLSLVLHEQSENFSITPGYRLCRKCSCYPSRGTIQINFLATRGLSVADKQLTNVVT